MNKLLHRFHVTMFMRPIFKGPKFILSTFFMTLSLPAAADPLVDEAKERWLHGDVQGVISLLEPFFEHNLPPYGNQRDALRISLALAYEQEEDWALAANQYALVRKGNRTLSKFATCKEPFANLKAKQFWTVKSNCKQITQKMAHHPIGNECLMYSGMAAGELKQIESSASYFNQYLAKYPQSPYAENLQLQQAIYTYRVYPQKGLELLKYLYLNHSYPTTDTQILAQIPEGFELQTLDERLARISSFIRGNRLEEAWTLFQEVAEKIEKTDIEEEWIDLYTKHLSWKTRHFDIYIELLKKELEQEDSAETAYKIFRGYCKNGQWDEAATFGLSGLDKYQRKGRWAGAKDEIARSLMFAKRYPEAATLWGEIRGYTADFYEGFSLYMAQEYTAAESIFLPLIQKNTDWDSASAYWLSRIYTKTERDPQHLEAMVMERDSVGWYSLWIKQRHALLQNPDTSQWHKGLWTLPKRAQLNLQSSSQSTDASLALQPHKIDPQQKQFDWSAFQDSASTQSPSTDFFKPSSKTKQPSWPNAVHKGDFPNGYDTDVLGTAENLAENFEDFIQNYKSIFPNLLETQLLVEIGLYPEAARNMAENFENWMDGRNGKLSAQQNTAMRKANISQLEWRLAFIYTRSHHYVLRFTTGLEEYTEDSAAKIAIKKLNYPTVRPQYMWEFTEKYNVDPWLMWGLMRQESAYQEKVQSWVGAIGYIQVMPATGAKLAFLLNEPSYSPKDLEIPRSNLHYGIYYFSKLMERFDNAYPLAVGSYNGGPHNMSRWYRDRMGTWEMDEFVEHIPYDETRKYIKKVTGHYHQYVELYDPQNPIYIPNAPLKDDATIIDF